MMTPEPNADQIAFIRRALAQGHMQGLDEARLLPWLVAELQRRYPGLTPMLARAWISRVQGTSGVTS